MREKLIVGIDEAGRGPLAGPVIACAFISLQPPYDILHTYGLRDSKLLSRIQREIIYTKLRKNPEVEWGIGRVSEKQIDKINIFQATRLAMKKAVLSLERKLNKRVQTVPTYNLRDRVKSEPGPIIDSLIIDGNMQLDVSISQRAIIRADTTIMQCMAASIIAKVTRDRLMLKYHKKYPQYGFDRHKGYGTTHHLKMLRLYGPCAIHRRSFSPCRIPSSVF